MKSLYEGYNLEEVANFSNQHFVERTQSTNIQYTLILIYRPLAVMGGFFYNL